MKRLVVALIWIMFLFLVVGGCSTKDQCSADTDCKTGYACGDDKKCHEIEVVLLFQDITDGQTLTIADDVDESDGIIQIDITVAAQTPGTATPLKDGTPVTLEVKSSAAAAPDDDAVNGAPAAVTKSYAGILVNGFARFLRIPFEEGSHVVTAYLTLSPAEKVIANLTATYQQAETLVMRYYKGGTVPTMLEGATLDDNDDLDAGTALFQVKMEAVTTGYPDGQEVELFIDEFSETAIGVAEIQDGVAAFPSVTVPIWGNIVLRVKSGAFEDTLAFSVVSAQSCGFALNIKNDDRFGMADDTSAPLNGLQKALIISDVTLCSTGSEIEIYIDGTPGTDEPDETLSLGGATLQQVITLPESAAQDDTHTVTVVLKDDDSSATGQMTVTGLFIDITAPALTVTAPQENATLTPVDDTNANVEGIQIAVTGSASDTLSDEVTVEVRDGTTLLGDTTGTGDYTVADVSFTATNEALTLAVTARDAVGNETVVEVPLKVYVNDPVIAFQTICAKTPAMNMPLNAADDSDQLAGGVQCAIIVRTTDIESAVTEVSLAVNDETPLVETIGTGGLTLFDMVTLPDGEDTLEASVMHLGVLRTAAITVQVDATLPAVTLTLAPTVNGGYAQSADADFAFSCSEANCEYRFRIDSGAWSAYATTATATYTALAEGLHVFEVMARDPFGNEGDETVFNWTIDHTAPAAPTVTGTTPTNDTTPTWSWTAPTGAVEYRYSTDETNWTTTTELAFTPATALAEATHTLYVQARDAAGNWSTSGSFAVTIDTTATAAPVVTGTTPTNDTTPKWSWDAVAVAVEYRYSYTDGTGWATTVDNFFIPATALTAGDHTLFVQARDAAGNWSVSGWFIITIDLTAPDAPTVLATTPTNDTTPNWTWIPVSDAVNYRYSYDELNWAETTGTTFTPGSALTAGSHTLYVQAQDAAGNWSVSGSKEVVIDLSAPDAPVVTGTTPTNDTTPEWSWGAVTGAVEYRYSFTDGSGWTTTTGLSFTPTALAEGFHTLFVQARNGVGTWSGSGLFTIEIDTTAPAAPVVTGTTPTSDTTPEWSWNTPAGTVEFRYSYTDGSGWTTTAGTTFTAGTLAEGTHTLYVQGRDAAGNWSTSGSFAVTIDTTAPAAPTVTGTTPTNDTTPTWSWNTPASAVNFRYSYTDGSGWTETTNTSFTAAVLTPGTYTLYVQAADAAGNWSPSGSFAITIDTTAPAAPLVTGTTPTNDTTPTWSWNIPAGTVEFRYSYTDGSGWTTTAGTSYTPGSALGETTHTLYVQGRDAAGNWSTSGSFAITIDTTAPAAPTVTGTTPTNNDQPTWSWDTPAGTVEFRYSFTDGSGWMTTANTSFAPGSALIDGDYTLYVQGRDAAGNWSTSGSFEITIDTDAPTLSIGAPSATVAKNGTNVTYTVTYTGADSVTLAAGNITLNTTGGANGTVAVSGSGTATRTVTISNVTGDGTLGISIAAGTASDTAGNTALAAGPSTTFTVDNSAPTLNITAPTAAASVNGDEAFTFTVSDGAVEAKIGAGSWTAVVSGALLNTLSGWAAASEGNFTVDLRSTDTAGNIGTTNRTFSKDTVAPTLSIGAPSATLVKNGTDVTYTVTYTGADSVTLAAGNITLNTTGGANGTVAVSGGGTATRTVTISNVTGDGTLGISIAAGTASDTAGNTALAAGPSTTFTVDNSAPTLNITAPTAAASVNGDEAFTFTVSDGTVEAKIGAGSWTAVVSGDLLNTLNGWAAAGEGNFTVDLRSTDTVGNVGTTNRTFSKDTVRPTLSIGAPSATAAKNGDSVLYTVTYTGADSVTLAAGNITLNTTGGANGTVAVSGSGTATRTVTISNLTGNGTLGISIAAGTASDTAGNTALAAGPSTTFDVDNTPPTVVIDPVDACTRRTTGTITFTVTGATTTTCRFDKPDATFVQGACGSSYNYTLDGGDGTYTLTVTATDDAANSDSESTSFSLNTTTPTFQWFLPPSGTSYKAGSAVPSFVYRTKNLEAGETVEIWDADANVKVAEGTTAGSLCNTTEDVSIPLDLPDKCGTYKLYAKVNDGVDSVDRYTDNLTALPATQRNFTFDRDKPVITSFVITNDADSNNILIAAEDLDATLANGMQATIVITVQDAIDIGRTVTLRNKTTGNTYTATVAGDRTATFTSITIPEGSNSFGATLTDCGGNTSDESAKTIIVDTTPPSVLFQGPTGATPGHPLWLTARDGVVNGSDELTGQQLKFKITGDWDNATPVVKHTVYDYDDPAAEVSTYTYTAGEMTIAGTTVTIDLDPLAYNQHEFEITVSDARGNTRVASRTYELDPKTPNALITYPADEQILDTEDEDAGKTGLQFTLKLDLTKLQTPTGTASTIDILAIPITALGGTEDGTRNRKSWSGFIADTDGANQTFPNDASFLQVSAGFWRLTVKATDDHQNVYDTALLPLEDQIDVEVQTNAACFVLKLDANAKVIDGRQVTPTWLNSNDGAGVYDLRVETDAPDGDDMAWISVNGGAAIYADIVGGKAVFAAVALNTGGVENTIAVSIDNGVVVTSDTYYVRADITDPTLDPANDVNPEPYVHAGIWEIGYGWNDDINHDTATTLELDGASVNRLIFTIDGIEDIVGYPNHGTVVLTAVDPVDAIDGNTTVNIEKVGADMVAEFDDLTFEDSVVGGQTDIEMLVTITEQPSGNTFTKTIFVHVNLEKPEGITPTVTTDPARGEAFVEWSALIGNNSTYGGAFQNRVYEYQVKYEAYGGACSLDDSESVFDTGVAVIPLTDYSVADPSLNGDDFVAPKAAGEAQNYRFYLKKRQNGALTQTADIHRNGDPYCFAVRASDGVYAQDGTILATNTAPVLSTNVVDKGALQLTAHTLIADSAGSHGTMLKNIGDLNGDGRTDFVWSDPATGTTPTRGSVSVFISSAVAPTKVDLSRPADAGDTFGLKLATGDFNGDTKMDVIATDSVSATEKKVHIFYGTGNTISTTRGASLSLSAITDIDGIGDYNGDGCDDFAAGDYLYSGNTGRVVIIFGAGTGCTGNYATPVKIDIVGVAANDRFGYTIRKGGRLNNDSFDDFVAGNYDTGTNTTKTKAIYGTATPGDVTLSAYDLTIAGLAQIRSLQYGNLNGDAYDDVVFVESGNLRILKGSATGIAKPGVWTAGVDSIAYSSIMTDAGYPAGSGWGIMSAGEMTDMDDDGNLDLLAGNSNVQMVYSGEGTILTLHPALFVLQSIASGLGIQTSLKNYGVVVCDKNSGKGGCTLYYR